MRERLSTKQLHTYLLVYWGVLFVLSLLDFWLPDNRLGLVMAAVAGGGFAAQLELRRCLKG